MATKGQSSDELFRRLFDLYYDDVLRFFIRKGCSAEDSRDLAQDTFFKAYRGLKSYEGRASFKTWLLKIAINVLRNWWRRGHAEKRAANEVSLDEEIETGLKPADMITETDPRKDPLYIFLAKERFDYLKDAIVALPPQEGRCTLLRAQGLKYREIGLILKIETQTVKSHLNQARKRLLAHLAENYDLSDER